jgi:hypothetical protein
MAPQPTATLMVGTAAGPAQSAGPDAPLSTLLTAFAQSLV